MRSPATSPRSPASGPRWASTRTPACCDQSRASATNYCIHSGFETNSGKRRRHRLARGRRRLDAAPIPTRWCQAAGRGNCQHFACTVGRHRATPTSPTTAPTSASRQGRPSSRASTSAARCEGGGRGSVAQTSASGPTTARTRCSPGSKQVDAATLKRRRLDPLRLRVDTAREHREAARRHLHRQRALQTETLGPLPRRLPAREGARRHHRAFVADHDDTAAAGAARRDASLPRSTRTDRAGGQPSRARGPTAC